MADIRINALANTATSAASDDYLALDGSANGTRKILATNVAQNVTDVTLGSAGPSVKSSLSARAPRQGLVFDGTAGASMSTASLGTGDFTFSAVFKAPAITGSNYSWLFGGNTSIGIAVWTQGVRLTKVNVAEVTTFTATISPSLWYHLAVVKASGFITAYLNGVQIGTPFNDSAGTYTGSAVIGGYSSTSSSVTALSVISPLIYNRALSASEVVALYEAGAPAGADYNTASNTNAATNWTNSGIPYTTFSGGSATGFTATSNGSGGQIANIAPTTFPIVKGTKWRVTCTLTLNSGTAPSMSFGSAIVANLASNVQQLSAGSNTLEFTVTSTTSSSTFYCYNNSTAANFSISGFSLTPLGLLLAPDAAQAGGGLTWYDTSGNAANITLPASGVSWNVPSSQVLGGNWTTSGNLTVSGTGWNTFAGSIATSGSNSLLQASTSIIDHSAGTFRAIGYGANTSTAAGFSFIGLSSNGTVGGTRFSIDSSGNSTFAGNLTVSGTGGISIGSATFTGGRALTATTGSGNNVALRLLQTSVADWEIKNVATTGRLAFQQSSTDYLQLTATGNLLLKSDGIDSGNGKLQLATHTTSAGGIGFGTDTSIWRVSSGVLAVNARLRDGTFSSSYLDLSAGGATLSANGILTLNSGATTALTLDSSQRMLTASSAAFGGTTFLNLASWTAGSSGFGADNLDKAVIGHLKSSTNGATIAGHTWPLTGWAPLNIAGTSLTFRTNGETIALTISNTQVATFAAGVDVGAASYLAFTNRSAIRSSADGLIRLTNWSDTDFTRLQFGGTTASFPALKRSTSVLTCVLADDSAFTTFRALDFSAQGAATAVGANQVSYGGTTATTATAGAQTLPANPVGFIIVNVAGTTAKIPYYAN